jgi:uncharacterized protein (DUF2384 family)
MKGTDMIPLDVQKLPKTLSKSLPKLLPELVTLQNRSSLVMEGTGSLPAILKRLRDEGIGSLSVDTLMVLMKQGSVDDEEVLEQLRQLNHNLEESVGDPNKGWKVAEQYFPDALLSDLVGIAPITLKRYKEGERETPNEVAARLHWLLITALDLSKSYNPRGVQNWFHRPRSKLKNKAPVQLLKGGKWHSDDKNIQTIRDLARGSIFADGAQ